MKLNKPIVFVHVEKVGGMSVNIMLHNYLFGFISPSPERGYTVSEKDFRFIKKWYPINITGIGGHRIDSRLKYFEDQFVFSMVREPIDRLISHYNWQKFTMGIDRSFEEFYQDPHFQNFQTFRLTGYREEASALDVIQKKYDFIGLLEAYNDSIQLLSNALFSDPNYLRYSRENTTSKTTGILKKSEISEETMLRLEELNRVDITIYSAIKEQFYNTYGDQLTQPNNNDLKVSTASKVKRKLSNGYLRYGIQPFIQDRVDYGY